MNTKIHYFYIPRKRWTIFIERKGRRCSQEITDSSDYTDYTLGVHLTSQLSFRRPKGGRISWTSTWGAFEILRYTTFRSE